MGGVLFISLFVVLLMRFGLAGLAIFACLLAALIATENVRG
jgi:hypothetical protein